MEKILIHSELISLQNSKVQFQIKLPSNTIEVNGILSSIERIPNPANPPLNPLDINAGSLYLRIASRRDVFFSDQITQSSPVNAIPDRPVNLGLGMQNTWWFNGRKMTFLSLGICPGETIIEGYYEDTSPISPVNYSLKIYLKTRIDD